MRYSHWLIVCVLFFPSTLFADVVQIDAERLKKLMQSGITVVDVRTPGEWKQTGIVEGSEPIMFFDEKRQPQTEQWMQKISQLVSASDELILICRTGNRSGIIANYLVKQHQFTKVYNVQRGIKDWIANGNKTVAPH